VRLTEKVDGFLVRGVVLWRCEAIGVFVNRDNNSSTYPEPRARATGLPNPESYLSGVERSARKGKESLPEVQV
jgi:hypothetical protein